MNFYRLIFDKVIYKHPNTTVIQTSKTDNSQNSGEKFLTKTNNEQAPLNLLYKCTRTCTYKTRNNFISCIMQLELLNVSQN